MKVVLSRARMKDDDLFSIDIELDFKRKILHVVLALLGCVVLRPFKSQTRHFSLKRVFIFTSAMFAVIGNCIVVIALHAFNPVLNKKLDYFVYKRGITAQIAEVVDLINAF